MPKSQEVMPGEGASVCERLLSGRPAQLARRGAPALAGLVALGGAWVYGSKLDAVYAIRDWLFWRIALLWLYPLILSAACTSFGYLLVSRLIRERLPVLETLVYSMAAGLVCFDLFMYAGGALGWFHLWFAVALPASMLAAGGPFLIGYARRIIPEWRSQRRTRRALPQLIWVLAVIFGVIGAALVYLPLLTPDAINFDAAWCHLTTSQDYARHGRIVPFVGDYARNVPQLASFVHTWGWLLPVPHLTQRWTLPLHTEFSMFLWTLVGVAAMARWLLRDDSVRGTWAVFFLFPAIFVYDSNLAGAADHFLAFFSIPLFLAVARGVRRFDPRWCGLAGLFAAGALLTKYQAIYPLAGVGVVFLLGWLWHVGQNVKARIRPEKAADIASRVPWKALLLGPLAIAGVGLVAASPHFIKNWVFYHNPLYPFGQAFFTHSTPTVPNAVEHVRTLLEDPNWRPTGSFTHRVGEAIEVFATFSFKPHYSFTKDWPCFGGLFTFSLPLLLFVRRPGRAWLGALAASGGVLTWAMVFRVDRNLQVIAPLLIATTAAILVGAWRLGWLARVGVVLLVSLQLVWGGDAMFYSQEPRISAAIHLISSGYNGRQAGERVEYRKAFRGINQALPPGSRTIMHNLRRSLGIEHELWLDMPGQQAVVLYEGITGPRGLYDYYKQLQVTHLLHMPGARPAWAKHDDVLFNVLAHRYGVNKRRFGGYELIELPEQAPPPDQLPWNVLSLGIYGYRDGLYQVEKMQVYELLPKKMRQYPRPDMPFDRRRGGFEELLSKAAAVTLSPGYRLDSAQRELLEREFGQIARYRSHMIYLRRP